MCSEVETTAGNCLKMSDVLWGLKTKFGMLSTIYSL
jgi:hypothetical protein